MLRGRVWSAAGSILALALMLSGCGGGGGGGGGPQPLPPPPSPPPPPPPPTSGFNTAEYQASNSAVVANALPAYQAGASGSGVKVAVVDTGINPNLPEFAGRIDPASQDVAANRGLTDTNGHGTMVSGVIAANNDGVYMHGVAFDATILSLNVGDPAGCINGNDCFLDASIDEAIDLARTNGARIINMSFGDEEGMTAAVWPAIQRAIDAGMIIVLAAGNDPTPNPNGFALQNIQNNGDSGLFIVAGAIDSARNIASFSSRAGTTEAANYYLAALGVGNATVNPNGAHVTPSGTSFSTPTIVGAAALLAGAFPNLTGAQIVNLLLTTADDAGAPGIDAIYGRGILNIGRAFQPQGGTSLAGMATPFALAGNGVSSGPLGDSLAHSDTRAVILDGYKRAYELDLGATIGVPRAEQRLRQGLESSNYQSTAGTAGPVSFNLTVRRAASGALRADLGPTRLAEADGRTAQAVAGMVVTRLSSRTAMAMGISQSGHSLQQRLSGQWGHAFLVADDPLARSGFYGAGVTSMAVRHSLGPLAVTVTAEQGHKRLPELRSAQQQPSPTYRTASLSLDGRAGPASYRLGLTRLDEQDSILGSRFAPTIMSGGSRTMFADASFRFDLGNGWRADQTYRHGWTNVAASNGIVENGRVTSEAFAATLSRSGLFSRSDRFALGIGQPLRVSAGGLNLYVPVSYSYSTATAAFGERFIGLTPKGRELDYELAYSVGALGGRIDLNAFIRTDPGNIEWVKRDAGGAIRFRLGL